jgi:hypothetical protein
VGVDLANLMGAAAIIATCAFGLLAWRLVAQRKLLVLATVISAALILVMLTESHDRPYGGPAVDEVSDLCTRRWCFIASKSPSSLSAFCRTRSQRTSKQVRLEIG